MAKRRGDEFNIEPEFPFKKVVEGGYTIYASRNQAWPGTDLIVRCDKCGAKVIHTLVREVTMITSRENTWPEVAAKITPHTQAHTARHKEAEERNG